MHENEAKPFGWLLGCTGIASILVIVFPGLAVAGYMMGIFPGILLGAAPSLLIYLVAWWALRRAIMLWPVGAGQQRRLCRTASVVAAILVLAAAVMIPITCNLPLDRAPADYQATDIAPPQPLALAGVVAVIPSADTAYRKPSCDVICEHLLFETGVMRVIGVSTALDGQRITSYRIERRSECPRPALSQRPPLKRIDNESAAGQLQRFRRRIAAGECLIEEPGHVADADVTIQLRILYRGADRFSMPWRLTRDIAEVRQLEIVMADNRVLYRRTEVTADRLMTPLFSVATSGLLTTVSYVGWSRVRTVSSPLGIQGDDALRNALASLNSGQ